MKKTQFEIHEHLEQTHWWFVARRKILRSLIRELLPPSQGKCILDVGCGTGGNMISLCTEYKCIGTDISEIAIESAKRRFPNLEFHCGDAVECLKDDISKIDLFLITDVLEHIEEDRKFVLTLAENAKPGSIFLITVPANPDLWTAHDEAFGHFRRYLPSTLRTLWSGVGCEELLLSYFNSFLYLPSIIVRKWMKKQKYEGQVTMAQYPEPLNGILRFTFEQETPILRNFLAKRSGSFPFGVSLMAVYRKLS